MLVGIVKRTHSDGGQDISMIQKPLFDGDDHLFIGAQIIGVTVEDNDQFAGEEKILDLDTDIFGQLMANRIQNQIEIDVGIFFRIGFNKHAGYCIVFFREGDIQLPACGCKCRSTENADLGISWGARSGGVPYTIG